MTARLLAQVRYPKCGVMLDTGHLMHTNPALRTPDEAVDYIHRILDRYADLSFIKGIHLHQSLTGDVALDLMQHWQPVRAIIRPGSGRSSAIFSRWIGTSRLQRPASKS